VTATGSRLPARVADTLAALLGFVAFLLWCGTSALVLTMHGSDAAGNAMSHSFAILGGLVLWILLGLLMAIALRWTPATPSARLTTFVGWAAGFFASLSAIMMLEREPSGLARLLPLIPVLAPLLVLAHALLAWRAHRAARVTSAPTYSTAGGIVVLALLLIPAVIEEERVARDTERRVHAADSADTARERDESDADRRRLAALGDTAALREYLAFTTGGNPLRDSALTLARGLPTRQAQAETLLAEGDVIVLDELQGLALELTEPLCRGATETLRRHAETLRAEGTGGKPYAVAAFRVERHDRAIALLAGGGCRLGDALDAYEAAARAYPADPQRDRFLAKLSGYRSR
jgi:hypothetical protein